MEEMMILAIIGPHAFSPVHNEPNLSLHSYLADRGWSITSSPTPSHAILSMEAPTDALYRPKLPEGCDVKGLLLIQEPSIVRPFNQSAAVRRKFARVIDVGRVRHGVATPWPAMYLEDFSRHITREKAHRACMVSGNKLSFLDGELYSLRREVAIGSRELDLYGTLWDSSLLYRSKQVFFEAWVAIRAGRIPRLRSLKFFLFRKWSGLGPVRDKISINAGYKVSVVIENSAEYMSEKLLEAIAAGSIPVYVGPDVQDFGIPSSVVIQVQPRVEAVLDGIDRALDMDYGTWVADCQKWLADPEVKEFWSLQSLWNRIHSELLELAGEAKSGNPSNF